MEEDILQKYVEAGRIAAQAREFGISLIRPGASVLEVAEKIEKKIISLGGAPAFPVNISFNETAAHYTPLPDDPVLFEDQLVKLDVGAHVDGFVGGDTAATIDLSGKYSDLVKASEDALNAAIKIAQIGTELCEIGREIELAIASFGFNPVRNLSGHGIGELTVHDYPSIPNYDNGDRFKLEEGMMIAIEPFATSGVGFISEKGIPYIHSITAKKPVRNIVARQVLGKIDSYQGLPFATRWLAKDFPVFKVNFALKEFNQLEILKSYPPLVERSNGMVSQAEHSLFIGDKVRVLTRF